MSDITAEEYKELMIVFVKKMNARLIYATITICGFMAFSFFKFGMIYADAKNEYVRMSNSYSELKSLSDANTSSIRTLHEIKADRNDFNRLLNRFDEHIENGTHYYRFKNNN